MVVVARWLCVRFFSKSKEVRFRSRNSDTPDLHTQLEELLDQVWRSEADWRLWDRLDAAERLETLRRKRDAANRDTERAA
jgi:hypothetical protein